MKSLFLLFTCLCAICVVLLAMMFSAQLHINREYEAIRFTQDSFLRANQLSRDTLLQQGQFNPIIYHSEINNE